MDFVYVLVRNTGEYDYRSECPIGAYELEEDAKKEALAQTEMRDIFETAFEAFKSFHGTHDFSYVPQPAELIQKHIKPDSKWKHRLQHPDPVEKKQAQKDWVAHKEEFYKKQEEYLASPEIVAIREKHLAQEDERCQKIRSFERDEDIRFLAFLIAASGHRDQSLVGRVTKRIQAQLDRRESGEVIDMVSRKSDFFQGSYQIINVVFHAKKD